MRRSVLLVLLALAPVAARAAPPIVLEPARVRPGDAFLVLVRDATAAPDGEVAGRRLAFFAVPGGHAAVAGLPIEERPGPLRVEVRLAPGEGRGAAAVAAELTVERPRFGRSAFTVPKGFVEPPAPDVAARIEADREAVTAAYARGPAAPLFTGPFALPRDAKLTARYGETRTLNGVKPSQHYGLDLQGGMGDPVHAANDGEVVLLRDCWASGLTLILAHGAGLHTAYFHLSRADVREGDRVARGQLVGAVGMSGRASGPHLHWGVKVNDLYVDPESVLRLRFDGR